MQYNTGTVTTVHDSNVITGSGTLWLINVSIGDAFKIASEYDLYVVASVDSDTQITLSAVYTGTGASSLSYQIVRDFTATLELMELYPGDRDWPIHLTLETIRKLETLFATTASPQFGGLVLGTDTGHNKSIICTQENPIINTWYDTGITLASNEAFSAILNILYEDDADHTNDRSALVHIGGYNGGTCTPTYLSRPNGSHIWVQVATNKIQIGQTLNTGVSSRLSAFIEYTTHEAI
jgi:hypothetical protein